MMHLHRVIPASMFTVASCISWVLYTLHIVLPYYDYVRVLPWLVVYQLTTAELFGEKFNNYCIPTT